ncbi:MAG TPA: GAF domain-containing protein, partial [Chitinophagaceae bacterium]|nr:GAF domain-containing protein [Chitinophagaceae bacterium]
MKKSKLRFISYKIILYPLLFSCMLVFLFSLQSHAQLQLEKGLPFITNYSAKTYKALPQTWCIQEDNRGIMYFGIQNYILEYDGVKWRKIIAGNNTSTVVRSMARNKDGIIYYGAYSDLGYFDKDSLGQTITRSLLNLIPADNRNFLDIWSTYTTENSVYFQSREYIFRINEKKADGKREAKVWKPQTRFMYSFYVDGDYYVHQQGLGLYKMINDSLILVPGSEFLGKERMQIMLPYPAGANGEKQYLIGMFYSGLYIYNGKTFRPFVTKADALLKSGVILYKGIQLQNGNYVLSSTGIGLIIIDPQGNLLQKINRAVGLQDESIYAVYLDKKGTLWLALDNGISRVETASPLTQFNLQSGISTAVSIARRFDGDMYVGTTNGLLRYNSDRQYFELVPGIAQNQIFGLLPNGNELLIAGDGLFAVKNKKGFTIRPSVSGDLTLSALYISKKDPGLLLGGGTSGVTVFKKKNQLGDWEFKGYIPGIADQIWTFTENQDGTFWAGAANGWDYRLSVAFDDNGNLDLKKTSFKKYGVSDGYPNGVGSVVSVKGINYFLADSSLFTFDDHKQKFIPDTTFGKFPNGGGATESALIADPQGRVWIRFGKETRLAIPKPGGGYRIENTPLNSINELTIQNFYPEKNGIVWICTTDGLIRYDENIEKNNDQSFKTILRHIEAEKTSLSTDTTDNKKSVSISFKNNTLRFEYAAPFFEQEDKTQYQTWLEGFEKDWSNFDNNYYKEYTNLPSGDYHFHVRAKNIYNKLSEEGIYNFSILPPWYRTWWAYLLYALVAAAIIYSLIRWRTHQLHEKHRELEKTVAERTAQLSHRVEELAVINSVQDGLVREMDMQGIYELVGEKMREIFNAQIFDIVTYDRTTNLLKDRYSYEKGDRTLVGTWEPLGFRKHVIETGQLMVINEDLDKKSIAFNSKVIHGEQPKSAVFVPLISGSEVKGMISLQNLDKEHAFSDTDVNLLTTLANSMSVALESARRFDETTRLLKETEQRNAELAVINSVQESLVAKMDINGIYELVGEKIREIFDAQVIDIVMYDRNTSLIEDRYAYEKGDRTLLGPRQVKGFRKHVIQTKQLLLHNENIEQAMRDFDNEILIGEKPKSQVYVPMIAGGEVKGIISLQNLDHEHAFSDSDVSLITTLANSMTVALESARLFDETTRLLKETEQRTAELAVINSVQEGLAKELDMRGIYNLIGDRVQKLFNAQAVIIGSFDLDNKIEHFNYLFENGEKVKADSRPINKLRQLLVDKKKSIYISTEQQAIKEYGLSAIPGTKMSRSLLFVPLLTGTIVRGYVSLQNVDIENAFSDPDIRLLETLANSMSVALENARLFDETNRLLKETEQRTAELAVINSVQEGLAKELDMQGIYELVGDRLCSLFPDTQTLVIRTFDHETGIEHFHYAIEKAVRFPIDARPFNWSSKELIATKKPLDIRDNYLETAIKHGGT